MFGHRRRDCALNLNYLLTVENIKIELINCPTNNQIILNNIVKVSASKLAKLPYSITFTLISMLGTLTRCLQRHNTLWDLVNEYSVTSEIKRR